MTNTAMLDEIYKKIQKCKDLEPVPGDFLIKKTMLELFMELAGLPDVGQALEIGCGSGVNAALLSGMCGRVIATDLPYYDVRTHSLGISAAQQLIARVGIDNVSAAACSGEALPFPDNTFDLVYSSSVLEHIADKEAAVREMIRVARPGGSVVFIIPTYIQSLCAFAHLYLYIAKRFLEVITVKTLRINMRKDKVLLPVKDDVSRSSFSIIGDFRVSHPSFPLPEPHGTYKSIFHEFYSQLPWNWDSLAKRCGASSIDSFAMLFLPFNILEVFSTELIARGFHHTRFLHRLLARSFLKYYSYSRCLIVRK